ncbi:unnamed protein product [Oikopleura dioica]|uniref:Uncharacterized protein n=1 Tax=Oikopleura dioica TaxID=34765 RepID=E4XSP5_OIKDI|nr:unnamed protein product [Oikopleura dioica]
MKSKMNKRTRKDSTGLFDANAAIDLAHAVQGLGLGMIDAGMEPLPEIPLTKRGNKNERHGKSCERFNLTASAKRALSSVLSNRRHKKRVHAHLRALSSFPDVPDHPIS